MSYQVTMMDVEARPTAVVPATTTWQEFPTLWRELMDEVWTCLHAGGISRGCRVIMLYWDDVPHVEVGVELLVPCLLTGRVRASALPAGQVAMTMHWGPYSQVRAGTSIPLGTQVILQVLWPPSPLHTGSSEELDNALVIRLVAPHFTMLLLGAAALSNYALSGLQSTIDHNYLQADIVQVVGKAFPVELNNVLQIAQPSLIIITPAALSPKLRKAHITSTVLPPQFVGASWQVMQTAQMGTIEIGSSMNGWNVKTE
jgi:hypothetical protein